MRPHADPIRVDDEHDDDVLPPRRVKTEWAHRVFTVLIVVSVPVIVVCGLVTAAHVGADRLLDAGSSIRTNKILNDPRFPRFFFTALGTAGVSVLVLLVLDHFVDR